MQINLDDCWVVVNTTRNPTNYTAEELVVGTYYGGPGQAEEARLMAESEAATLRVTQTDSFKAMTVFEFLDYYGYENYLIGTEAL